MGKRQSGSGINAFLVNYVGDSRDARGSYESRALNNEIQGWCTLHQAAVPLEPGEVVVKLSRHRVEGQVWTWLGLYQSAIFPDDPRRNMYIGAGLLAGSASAPLRDGLEYMASLVKHMFDAPPRVSKSAKDLADQLSYTEMPLRAAPFEEGGLSPEGHGRLYVDLSGQMVRGAEELVVQLLSAAERTSFFSEGFELFVGNSKRLSQSILGSSEFVQFDERGRPLSSWPPSPASGQTQAAAESRSYGSTNGPYRDDLRLDSPILGNGLGAAGPTAREERDTVQRRLDRLDRLVDGNFDSPVSSQRPLSVISAVATGFLLAMALLLAVSTSIIAFGVLRGKGGGDGALAQGMPAQNGDIANGAGSNCSAADATDDSPQGRQRLRGELDCLNREVGKLTGRINEIEGALPN